MNPQEKASKMLSRLCKTKHIIAVPDLHGSAFVAASAVNLLTGFDIPSIFLGDYCDRGTLMGWIEISPNGEIVDSVRLG